MLRSISICLIFATLISCQNEREHNAPAIRNKDSVSVMRSYGINTLISDSGVIKYRIITESYDVNQIKNPPRWTFDKGVFLEQYDNKFHTQLYIQCDTAYYYDRERIWELRGRVKVKTKDGVRFYSEELYRDENRRELYSNKYSKLTSPERTLQGNYFRSNETMTRYYVSNSKGSFIKTDFDSDNQTSNTITMTANDSTIAPPIRSATIPQRKR